MNDLVKKSPNLVHILRNLRRDYHGKLKEANHKLLLTPFSKLKITLKQPNILSIKVFLMVFLGTVLQTATAAL